MTPEQQFDALMNSVDPATAQAVILKMLFIKTAEIDGSIQAVSPVIGAIAGRLGITAEQIRQMTEGPATVIAGMDDKP